MGRESNGNDEDKTLFFQVLWRYKWGLFNEDSLREGFISQNEILTYHLMLKRANRVRKYKQKLISSPSKSYSPICTPVSLSSAPSLCTLFSIQPSQTNCFCPFLIFLLICRAWSFQQLLTMRWKTTIFLRFILKQTLNIIFKKCF